jgi:hypothetical protein
MQKRIRQLTLRTSVAPGDPGYIDPSSEYLAVDSDNYTGDPLKLPLNQILGSHTETGMLTSLSSATVSVTFDTAFSATPVGWVNVYKLTLYDTGKYAIENIQYYVTSTSWKTTTGFTIIIDGSLTDVIVEYEFKEA